MTLAFDLVVSLWNVEGVINAEPGFLSPFFGL
jgi:hypothetical protein